MRRLAILLGASTAVFLACELFTEPAETGGLRIQVHRAVADSAALARAALIDGARARIIGPAGENSQARVRTLTLREGTAFVDTVTGLPAGSYVVALEGLASGAIEEFGQAGNVTVSAGQNATANVAVSSFRATIQVAQIVDSFAIRVTVNAVPGAASYDVAWSGNPTFAPATETTVPAGGSPNVRAALGSSGRYYVRARAVNEYDAAGVWSDALPIDVDVTASTIVVTPDADTLSAIGDTAVFGAEALSGSGGALPGKTFTWSSSNTSVASVTPNGEVIAVANGTATITASTDGINGSANAVVIQRASTVSVTAPADTLTVGGDFQFSAFAEDSRGNSVAGASFAWQSTDDGVATVDESGLVSAVAAGVVTISATADGVTGDATVDVIVQSAAPVDSVAVTPATATLTAIEDTVLLTAQALDSTGAVVPGKVFTWTSSAPGVADVTSAGAVVAVTNGNATITASADGVDGTASIIVAQAPDRVVITASADTVFVGTPSAFAAEVRDSRSNPVASSAIVWVSRDPLVATVATDGTVSGQSGGTTTIAAFADSTTSGIADSVDVVIVTSVATVTITPSTDTVIAGATVQFTAEMRDADGIVLTGRGVTWETGDAAIATVDGTGLVMGEGAGTTDVIATSEGVVDTASVTVLPAVDSVAITPVADTILEGNTTQLTAQTLDADGNVLTGRAVTWASTDSSIATPDGTGLVTGGVQGNVTITATSENAVGSAAITVITSDPVATVVVTPAVDTVNPGTSTQLVADPQDASGTSLVGRPVTWASSDDAVATVDAAGVVTGQTLGTVTITATSEGIGGTAEVSVVESAFPFLACGDLVTDTLEVTGSVDVFELTGEAGDLLGLTLLEVVDFGDFGRNNARLTMNAPSGTQVGVWESDAQPEIVLPESGTYTLVVTADPLAATGAYRIGVECLVPLLSPDTIPIQRGEVLLDSIAAWGEVDLFTFTGAVGDTVLFSVVEVVDFGDFGRNDAQVTVYSPTGVEFGPWNADLQWTLELPEAGRYVARVSASPLRSSGHYNLGLEGLVPLTGDAVPLNCGDLLTGSIDDWGEVDFFTFTRTAGNTVILTLTEITDWGDFGRNNAALTLYAPSWTVEAAFESDGQSQLTLAESGQYVLRINADPLRVTGTYNLSLTCL